MNPDGSNFNSSEFDSLNSLNDNELIAVYRNDDGVRARQAVSALISRYIRLVRKRACGYAGVHAESDDLAQEGLLAFISAVRSFDPDRGAKFSSYADVCVTNGIRNAAMKLEKNAGESLAENSEGSGSEEASPENMWFEKERMYSLYKEISALLSKKEWSIFKLYVNGSSYKEISEKLDIPLKSVDNAVFRVRKKLKALLSQEKPGI